ncbi:MAG: adenosylcobalamin-dependent ribonucleoside-diphosphate reductase [Candidatus Nanoarchaeia archaeon]|nr:adenosylcobalamin-dependent ribonucleoside-diphosphate reductase [Candidatus Nanoarchaeia archaeon]
MQTQNSLKLSSNALKILEKRYLLKDDSGKIIETPTQMFIRAAKTASMADKIYGDDYKKSFKEFFNIMNNLEFLPNSPTLMNSGTKLNQLSACFVLPIEDSLESIFDTLKLTAKIHHSGGGTGFNFSHIRPEGDIVNSTKGVASGPIKFIEIYNTTTDAIKQGGKRRGANMGILNSNHPDIFKFINAKQEFNFSNFNLSVNVTNEFMEKAQKNENYWLINPNTHKKIKEVNAGKIFDLLVYNAWKNGDPGIIFIDEINKKNNFGTIESTNPCGEQPLLPYESCNLGSINLSKFVKNNNIEWEELKKTIIIAVHFLDNIIDINNYPDDKIKKITLENRKIGLGVMGWADVLIILNIAYNSDEALQFSEKIMSFIQSTAKNASLEIAKKRGSFPNFKKTKLCKNYDYMRNLTVTTIAPTGTISIIAGCSSGIEPLFALSFVRNILEGAKLLETYELFKKESVAQNFYSEKLMLEIAKKGSVKDVNEVPKNVKRIFVTALDIDYSWHVKMQAAFQKYTDNAVSKTINLPENATIKDVRNAYLLAYKLKCKGITVYRYKSKPEQVLNINYSQKCQSSSCQ